MRLGTVIGTATATVKADHMTGLTLLVVDLIDGAGTVTHTGLVAADAVGAGFGDNVLISEGSAARMAPGMSAAPIDLAVIAIVDRVSI